MNNNIGAICPKCNKPTKRQQGMSMTTCMYYPPILDERGININPDRNTRTTQYTCLECGTKFSHSTNGENEKVIMIDEGKQVINNQPEEKEIKITTKKDFNHLLSTQPTDENIVFSFQEKEMLKLCENGDIFVKGNLIENDKDVVNGFREIIADWWTMTKATDHYKRGHQAGVADTEQKYFGGWNIGDDVYWLTTEANDNGIEHLIIYKGKLVWVLFDTTRWLYIRYDNGLTFQHNRDYDDVLFKTESEALAELERRRGNENKKSN